MWQMCTIYAIVTRCGIVKFGLLRIADGYRLEKYDKIQCCNCESNCVCIAELALVLKFAIT